MGDEASRIARVQLPRKGVVPERPRRGDQQRKKREKLLATDGPADQATLYQRLQMRVGLAFTVVLLLGAGLYGLRVRLDGDLAPTPGGGSATVARDPEAGVGGSPPLPQPVTPARAQLSNETSDALALDGRQEGKVGEARIRALGLTTTEQIPAPREPQMMGGEAPFAGPGTVATEACAPGMEHSGRRPAARPFVRLLDGSVWTVQVASVRQGVVAAAERDRLARRGEAAFVQPAVIRRETWHRVFIGRYTTRAEAEKTVARLTD